MNVFKVWNIETDQGLVFEPSMTDNADMAYEDTRLGVIVRIEDSTDWQKSALIEEKLEGATYPRFGFTTAQKFENAEEYEAWLNEVWDEEREQYIEAATQAIIARIRVLQEDALEDLETTTEQGITRPDSYAPPCPICGMESTRDSDGEVQYLCGHFVNVFNGWYHEDSLMWDYVVVATHQVITSHEVSGSNNWYFAATPGLDDVMTASEVEARYGLAKDTVRQAIARQTLPTRKSAGVHLIRRADAEKRWGKK